MLVKNLLNVSVSTTLTVPPLVIVETDVLLLVLIVNCVLTAVTLACRVVSPDEEVVRLVQVLVDKIDVYMVVLVPATEPVVVVFVDIVPVILGL